MFGLTFFSGVKFLLGFKQKVDNTESPEIYNRLITLYQKNQYGFHTRIMNDLDLLVEALVDKRFIDDAMAYYDDPVVQKEIEDHEGSLNSDFAPADVKHLLKDPDTGHGAAAKVMKYPGRVGTNYDKNDDLSCYKVLPKGQKAIL